MSGHGHVIPNADGSLARCGGPGLCSECSREAAQLAMLAHCACGRPSQHASGWCGEVCGGWPIVSAAPPLVAPKSVPHRCPVCEGRGNVPWDPVDPWGTPLTTSLGPWACPTCNGARVLWGPA